MIISQTDETRKADDAVEEQVYAALDYYHANKDAVKSQIAAEDAESERLAREDYLTQQER